MNGAASLLQTLIACDVQVCFANPGTSEMQFVAALDEFSGMRAVLTLFEGVASGAADGYARMSGKPACVLLHLGSGLSNASANMHNARRARTPLVALVGDHATFHSGHDAPLSSDIEGLARPVSRWVRTVLSPREIADNAAEAVCQARRGGVATLIVPADVAWSDAGPSAATCRDAPATSVPTERILDIARRLKSPTKRGLLLDGLALHGRGLELATRIARVVDAELLCPTTPSRIESGAGRPCVARIPYFVDQARTFLARFQQIVLIGARAPVAFFAYPGKPSVLTPAGCDLHVLAEPEEQVVDALAALADELNASDASHSRELRLPDFAAGALTPANAGALIARHCPADAIVSDEGLTAGIAAAALLESARPHDHLFLTGGAIGQGMPVALGAALACPDRRVLNLQGDGSALYTMQALWSQARERAQVVTIIFANRAYAILNHELANIGAGSAAPQAARLLQLDDPTLDWVKLAEGMGVPAVCAQTTGSFADALSVALRESGPFLIEAVMP
jgi:acetolactate synthase-1/2/3 large subunit